MTNFEKYKDEILKLSEESKLVAVKLDGSPIDCDILDNCHECKLNQGIDINNRKSSCGFIRIRWLYEEYIEPIRLTRKQRKFLEFLEAGWIVRYESGKLGWYAEKPMWDGFVWVNKPSAPILVIDAKIVDFPFIESENKEPFSVEKMLTLEVEE